MSNAIEIVYFDEALCAKWKAAVRQHLNKPADLPGLYSPGWYWDDGKRLVGAFRTRDECEKNAAELTFEFDCLPAAH